MSCVSSDNYIAHTCRSDIQGLNLFAHLSFVIILITGTCSKE